MKNAVRDFTTIVNDLAADVTAMQATPPFDDVDAGLVVDALSDVSGFIKTLVLFSSSCTVC